MTAPLHVLIAGGGVAGLATAQGLLKNGHTVEVYERDTDLDRKQGYYLHVSPLGGNAGCCPMTCTSYTWPRHARGTAAASRSCWTASSGSSLRSHTSGRPTPTRP